VLRHARVEMRPARIAASLPKTNGAPCGATKIDDRLPLARAALNGLVRLLVGLRGFSPVAQAIPSLHPEPDKHRPFKGCCMTAQKRQDQHAVTIPN
jgi:hypothetical protein